MADEATTGQQLTDVERAWCDWAQRYRGSRNDPSSVVSFAAGAKYGERIARNRIREELEAAIERAGALTVNLRHELDRIAPAEPAPDSLDPRDPRDESERAFDAADEASKIAEGLVEPSGIAPPAIVERAARERGEV